MDATSLDSTASSATKCACEVHLYEECAAIQDEKSIQQITMHLALSMCTGNKYNFIFLLKVKNGYFAYMQGDAVMCMYLCHLINLLHKILSAIVSSEKYI